MLYVQKYIKILLIVIVLTNLQYILCINFKSPEVVQMQPLYWVLDKSDIPVTSVTITQKRRGKKKMK